MNYMQQNFANILKFYGHDVWLQRRTQTTDTKPAYSETLEKHTTRFSIYNSRGLASAQVENMEGLTNTSQRTYYFLPDVNPFEGDRIYESEERTEDRQSIWSIDQVVGMRGVRGEIIYWVAGVTRIKPN